MPQAFTHLTEGYVLNDQMVELHPILPPPPPPIEVSPPLAAGLLACSPWLAYDVFHRGTNPADCVEHDYDDVTHDTPNISHSTPRYSVCRNAHVGAYATV